MRRGSDLVAYVKTNWQDRVVEKPRTYTMTQNPDGTVTLVPAPGTIVQAGTPVSAVNMNKLETQYDQAKVDLDAKTNATTGHKHSGAAGDGPPVRYIEATSGARVEVESVPYLSNAITPVPVSVNCGKVIVDGEYAFFLSSTIRKHKQSDLSFVSEAAKSNLSSICQNTEFLFVGTSDRVYKIRKSDMTTVAQSGYLNYEVQAISCDNSFVYIAQDQRVLELLASDLTETPKKSGYYGYAIYSLISDSNNVFIGGPTVNEVWRLVKSDLSVASKSAACAFTLYNLAADETFLFASGNTSQIVLKLRKSDLVSVDQSLAGTYKQVAVSDDVVYVINGPSNSNKISALDKADLSRVIKETQNVDFGIGINAGIAVAGAHVFASAQTLKLYKLGTFYSDPVLRIVPD